MANISSNGFFGRTTRIARDLYDTRLRGVKHAFARRATTRYVVFESDDWGSERVPSVALRQQLIRKGILSGKSPYETDTIESALDFQMLFDVLASVTDADGFPAVFSCYANPANPDYERIRENDFRHYYAEPVSAALQRRGDMREVKAVRQEGVERGLVSFEYHGREHINGTHWLDIVRHDRLAREAFDLGFYSISVPDAPRSVTGLRAAYYFKSQDELPALALSVLDGVRMFTEEYGSEPQVLCPPNNIFHPDLYPAVRAAGCKAIIRHVRNPMPDGRDGIAYGYGFSGLRGCGLDGFGRNALFEPVQGYGVDHAMRGIASAFAWGVPAFVSTHRVNYIGGIDPAVRDGGLKALRELLRSIVHIWPDVRFISSRQWLALRDNS